MGRIVAALTTHPRPETSSDPAARCLGRESSLRPPRAPAIQRYGADRVQDTSLIPLLTPADPSRWEDPLRDERKLGAVRDGLGLWEGAGIDSARTREGAASRLSEALTRPTRGCGRSRPPRGRFSKSFGLFRSRWGRLRPT